MSSHYKWYPSTEETTVPWNARYTFPSQANKAVKITPRIPPKNGAIFLPGNVIRLEFPAQGYVNVANTTLAFDVTLAGYSLPDPTGATQVYTVRFQNNIQCLFSRVRLLYGATPLEDIINYNQIVRNLTEWTATNQQGSFDQTSISEGIGGMTIGFNSAGVQGTVNVRQTMIQGLNFEATANAGYVPNGDSTTANGTAGGSLTLNNYANWPVRRYQVQLALGLMTQDKLLPVKFMASQLAIEITLATETACIYIAPTAGANGAGSPPTYGISNVTLIPEILEFDASYDAMFLRGLREGGVPIKFSSWHTFIFSVGGQQTANLLIQERSRSVKAIFAVQKRSPTATNTDSGATIFCSGDDANSHGTLQNYQYRIGGRYFPAAPVQTSTTVGSAFTNGGCEAFVELQKALNTVGDYRLSSNVNTMRWALNSFPGANTQTESDYSVGFRTYTNGVPQTSNFEGVSSFCGNIGSSCFAMATSLETSNGLEISGLNAEEQSDISLLANWSTPQAASFTMEVYTYYDAMIILRENNVVELIQ